MSNKMSVVIALGLLVSGAVLSVPAIAQGSDVAKVDMSSPFDVRGGGTFVAQRDLIKEGRSVSPVARSSTLGFDGNFIATDLSPEFNLQPGGTFKTQDALRSY